MVGVLAFLTWNFSASRDTFPWRLGTVKNYAQNCLQAPAEWSQPAIETSSKAASKCFMFMYFLLPHWVPATWRSCSPYCSLGKRRKGSRSGCPAFLSKFIVIGMIRERMQLRERNLNDYFLPRLRLFGWCGLFARFFLRCFFRHRVPPVGIWFWVQKKDISSLQRKCPDYLDGLTACPNSI